MKTTRELIRSAPIAGTFFVLWIAFLITMFIGAGSERTEWVDACKEIGGIPILDRHHNGIGNSFCLKPDSILEVPGYETRRH